MEIWDLYTENREKTSKTMLRGENTPKGFYRLAVTVCIFNSEGKMLIQQRVPFKDDWPNLWDVSCAGSSVAGEDSKQAAEREVFEELGLKINLQKERPHFTNYFADGFNDIYILNKDLDLSNLKLQAEEVQNVKWATLQEIFTMLDEQKFIPYHKAWIELLFHRSKTRNNYQK